MNAITLHGLPAQYRSPLILSAAGHVLLALVLSTSLVFMPEQPLQQLAIEAVVIDQGAIDRAAEQQRQQTAAAERRKQAEQRKREQQLAAQRKADEQARRQKLARDKAARERAAEQQRQAQAEQRRREAERKQQEARQATRRAAEKQAAAARAKAAAEKREQQRRQSELEAAMQEEEALLAARQSGEINRYKMLIQQHVERRWVQPASAVAGVECRVSVQQLPNGDVIDARVTQCNGDELVQRSVENAVFAASPLPLPDDGRLFDRNLTFIFRPQVKGN